MLAFAAAGQVRANLPLIRMFFEMIHYEVEHHPGVDGLLIFWGVFGPSITRALRHGNSDEG
jgi:hypothetical protein